MNGFCVNYHYYFPFIFNHLLTNLLQEKPEKDGFLDYLISKFYIGDFYL